MRATRPAGCPPRHTCPLSMMNEDREPSKLDVSTCEMRMTEVLNSVLLCVLSESSQRNSLVIWDRPVGWQRALFWLWPGGVRGGGLHLLGVPKETSCLGLALKERKYGTLWKRGRGAGGAHKGQRQSREGPGGREGGQSRLQAGCQALSLALCSEPRGQVLPAAPPVLPSSVRSVRVEGHTRPVGLKLAAA